MFSAVIAMASQIAASSAGQMRPIQPSGALRGGPAGHQSQTTFDFAERTLIGRFVVVAEDWFGLQNGRAMGWSSGEGEIAEITQISFQATEPSGSYTRSAAGIGALLTASPSTGSIVFISSPFATSRC